MKRKVTERTLPGKISSAIGDQQGFLQLREFVLDYYAGEHQYVFASETLESAFAILASYLEYEQAYGDPLREERLQRLRSVIKEGPVTAEKVVFGLEYDRISSLMERLDAGVISRDVFREQVRKLSPHKFNWLKVVALYKEDQRGTRPS